MNKFKIKYCIEELKYRIFGLFPYITFDSDGIPYIENAKVSENGCYGGLICNIKIPCDFSVDGEKILSNGKSYSCKTLIRLYRKYSHMDNEPFIRFMKDAVGIKKVDIRIDRTLCTLVPDEVDYHDCNLFHHEMEVMKKMCDGYVSRKSRSGEVNCNMECMLDKYTKMGGDTMLAYYAKCIDDFSDIADYMYGIADIESTKFLCMDLSISESIHDIGITDNYNNIWDYNTVYYKGDIVVYEGNTYICNGNIDEDTGEDIGVKGYVDENGEYVFDYDSYSRSTEIFSNNVILSGISSSSLQQFKSFTSYTSHIGKIEEPDFGTDWLFYYEKGNVTCVETETDDIGNIKIFEGCTRVLPCNDEHDTPYETSLVAYGNVLTDITVDSIKKEIKFTYVIGAHLKAKPVNVMPDEFGNLIYQYKWFEFDESDRFHGVTHVETYMYPDDSEINTLVKDGNFDAYLSDHSISDGYEYFKCVFNIPVYTSNTVINGNDISFNYIPSDISAEFSNERDTMDTPLVRKDWFDSTSFNPIIENGVAFSRGNSASFERHIKLSEIKNLDAMLSYSNGGFFNII